MHRDARGPADGEYYTYDFAWHPTVKFNVVCLAIVHHPNVLRTVYRPKLGILRKPLRMKHRWSRLVEPGSIVGCCCCRRRIRGVIGGLHGRPQGRVIKIVIGREPRRRGSQAQSHASLQLARPHTACEGLAARNMKTLLAPNGARPCAGPFAESSVSSVASCGKGQSLHKLLTHTARCLAPAGMPCTMPGLQCGRRGACCQHQQV
jgi:hypothetical protein